MITISISFPGSRFHSTPWDHHVNEGVVEWPPSPWRIIRSLVATRHLKASDEIDEATLATLVEAMARSSAEYRIPLGSAVAHSRHYMPTSGAPTKVFDTFIHVSSDAPLMIVWADVALSEECTKALSLLLERLSYLGRAESWVEARLVPASEDSLVVGNPNVYRLGDDGELGPEQELFRLLSPLSPNDLIAWRTGAFEQELERQLAAKMEKAAQKGKDPSQEKLTKTEKDKIDALFPRSVLDALQVETGQLQKQGWSGVPGAHWVDYVRPRNLLSSRAPRAARRVTNSDLPTIARFAVASQVPPRLTEALSFAEKVRQTLMSRSDAHPVFSGKNATGEPLSGNQHTFICPEANGKHGRITHVTLFARMGFDDEARHALDDLRKVWGHGGHDVQLILLGVGKPEDFAGTNVDAGQCPLLVESTEWESRTPFVPTRHPKTRHSGQPKCDENGLQIGSAEHDLRRLLAEGGYPEPCRIESLNHTELDGKQTRWLAFRTLRKKGDGARGSNLGFGFQLTFDEPVRGPITLGYGAHFGLGLFVHRGKL